MRYLKAFICLLAVIPLVIGLILFDKELKALPENKEYD